MAVELSGIREVIFLDRYAKKGRREDVKVGNTVVVLTKEVGRWTEKQIGTVEKIEGDDVTVRLKESGELFTQNIMKIDLPLETKPEQMWKRMAEAIGGMEKDKKFIDDFSWLLQDFRFSPGGRIQAMAGANPSLTAYNCFVIESPKDSRGGIIDTLREQVEIMSRGGGVGINLSTLRPRHAYIRKVNGKSSGAVIWADLFSQTTNKIEQGGSRRGS